MQKVNNNKNFLSFFADFSQLLGSGSCTVGKKLEWKSTDYNFVNIRIHLNEFTLSSSFPDSMHTCSKFDFLWILSRYDKFVMANLWQNPCKANGIISDHSLAKQVCRKLWQYWAKAHASPWWLRRLR